MKSIILQGCTVEELVASLEAKIDQKLKKHTAPVIVAPDAERFLTKKEVAAMFSVTEVSIWDWERKGLLTGYRIGNLVRYKHSEVVASPKMILRKQKGGTTNG